MTCERYSKSICTSCIDGFGISGGNCVTCVSSGCLSCSFNASECTNCDTGYGLVGTTCFACGTSSPCLNCLGTDPMICASCDSGYYPSGGLTCNPCMTNCLDCLDGSSCYNCDNLYYVDGSNTCTHCPQNCTTCIY